MIRNIIDERAVYTKRTQDYTHLIKTFTSPELKEVGNYRIVKEIGCGAFGQIFLGYHKFLKMKVCLKRGERIADNTFSDNLMREYYYLREFRKHPNITKIYEIIFTETKAYMVLEYYPEGDLFEYLSKRKRIPTDEALKLFTQVVGAVYYMHRNGCCHRDLKLENILLDKKFNVKLSDFGFTRELPFAQHGSKSLLSEFCGTGAYMSPELIRKEPYSGIKTDVWALGVILYTMIAGEMPFDDTLDDEILAEKIETEEPTFNDKLFKPELQKLIKSLLSKTPEDRISSLDDVLRLPILQPYGGLSQIETVNKMMYSSSGNQFSAGDRVLLKELARIGLDKELILRSIEDDKLDSVYGFWQLLKEKNRRKSQRRKSKPRSRSMLRRSTSKSFIDNAKLAFSPSPTIRSEKAPETFLSRLEKAQQDHDASVKANGSADVKPDNSNSNGSADLDTKMVKHKKSKNPMLRKASAPKLEPPPKIHVMEPPKAGNNDQRSVSSNASSALKKKHKFSLKRLFGHKRSHSADAINTGSISTKSRSTTKSSSDLKTVAANGYLMGSSINSQSQRNGSSAMAQLSTPSTSKAYDQSAPERHSADTPTSTYLKRNRPTRPGSVISSYSMQTTISETSGGSGYLTGYSAENPSSSHQAQIASSGNGRPVYIRGLSDISGTPSSQPESPNSSFTGVSRSNSIDSSSRSLARGRSRRKKSASIGTSFLLKRGKSPLQSKMNAKWGFSAGIPNNHSTPKKFSKSTKQQQLTIEEEESDMEEEEEDVLKDMTDNELLDLDLMSESEMLHSNSIRSNNTNKDAKRSYSNSNSNINREPLNSNSFRSNRSGSINNNSNGSVNVTSNGSFQRVSSDGYLLSKDNSQLNLDEVKMKLSNLRMTSSNAFENNKEN
ncbi:unnamed protein product [Ambrosiozyma monospora]|uniref:non-specific serine/threonine protein kinase n=1 Tax=Ambrosiozyma monospora TaxID=43982 RepID=A0A9W6Z1Y6_AMBMO|nr:unnamed protein product [Ambrosiozyma monospora]